MKGSRERILVAALQLPAIIYAVAGLMLLAFVGASASGEQLPRSLGMCFSWLALLSPLGTAIIILGTWWCRDTMPTTSGWRKAIGVLNTIGGLMALVMGAMLVVSFMFGGST